MINNQELPIGFTMALAERSDILKRFAALSKEEQNKLAAGARNVNSREDMQYYVESMFREELS